MGKKRKIYIELRDEEVQEVMDEIPQWIIRYGVILLFIITILFLVGSWMLKYSDIINAEIIITSLEPPADIIARSTGRIDEIYVKNNQHVSKNKILAVIQNPAKTADMFFLLNSMKKWRSFNCDVEKAILLFPSQSLSLGNVQVVYAAFLNSINDFLNYKRLNYYPEKIISLKKQLIAQQEYYNSIVKQNPVIIEKYLTSESIFRRDSLLYAKEVISKNEYEISKNNFLLDKQTYWSFDASIKQSELQLIQRKENLLDLQQQVKELESKYLLSLSNATETLSAQIKTWENDYLMVSPIDGIVNLMGIWSINQNVVSGEAVFSILPLAQNSVKGKAKLPIQGAGKVQKGQRVNVRINNFPDQEFGYLIGSVISISSVPTSDGFYIVEVGFPEGRKTNYNVVLPMISHMEGNAEIVTNNYRLIERLFIQFKNIVKNNID